MLKTILSIALLAALVGCSPKEIEAPRRARMAAGHRAGGADLTLRYVQLFFWRNDATPEIVASVLQTAEELEGKYSAFFVSNRTFKALTAQIDSAGLDRLVSKAADDEAKRDSEREKVAGFKADLGALNTQAAGFEKQIEGYKTEIATLEKVDPQTEETKAKLAALQAKVTQETADLTKFKKDKVTPAEKKVKQYGDRLAKIEAAYQPYEDGLAANGLAQAFVDWKAFKLDTEAKNLENIGIADRLKDAVALYDSPFLKIAFETNRGTGQLAATIKNWHLDDIKDATMVEKGAPVEFSTDDRTIGNLKYDDETQVYEFEVYTPAASFWIKLSPAIAADNPEDDRIHYKGEAVRCSVEGGRGIPLVLHEKDDYRDIIRCGVHLDDPRPGTPVGNPVIRRGAANLADMDPAQKAD